MSANKNLWLATASAVVLFASAPAFAQNTQPNVTVVQPDGPAEQTGEAVDNAASNAANQADRAADAASNAADQAETAADNATETDTADAERPVQGQIFQQSPDQYLASTLLDAVVMNPADEEVGDVNDMIVTREGQVEGVVIGVGGFLGVGEKNVAIELSRLEITQDENGDLNFTLDATSDELANAPEFVTAADAQSEAEANSAAPAGGMGASTGATTPATQQ